MKIETGFWKGWEVFLTDKNGNRLREHRADLINSGVLTCFVECQIDQEFRVVVSRPPPSPDSPIAICSVSTEIDGRLLDDQVFGTSPFYRRKEVYEDRDGVTVAKTLKFNKLERSEGAPQIDPAIEAKLGTIAVTLESGTIDAIRQACPDIVSAPELPVIDEKVRKGRLDTYVGGDYIKPVQSLEMWRFTPDPFPPVQNFLFTYRTREALMAEGVIDNPNDAKATSSAQASSWTEPTFSNEEPSMDHGSYASSHSDATSEASSDHDDIVAIDPPPTKKPTPVIIDLTGLSDSEDEEPEFIFMITSGGQKIENAEG